MEFYAELKLCLTPSRHADTRKQNVNATFFLIDEINNFTKIEFYDNKQPLRINVM